MSVQTSTQQSVQYAVAIFTHDGTPRVEVTNGERVWVATLTRPLLEWKIGRWVDGNMPPSSGCETARREVRSFRG